MPARRTSSTRPSRNEEDAANKAERLTRHAIAKRLHDTVCQSVTGLRLLMSVAEKQLPPESTKLKEQFENMSTLLRECSEEVYAIVEELRGEGRDASLGAPKK